MRALDLYCCEGGAGQGYANAGYDMVGVDFEEQSLYPFFFVQMDVLKFLRIARLEGVTLVHASPPCQKHSTLGKQQDKEYPDLIAPTRELLIETGLPYVIENVVGAPLEDPVTLCGSMFGLGAHCSDGQWRQLRRHRLFETNWGLQAPGPCEHEGQPIGVYGTGGGGQMTRGYKGNVSESREAMGMPWASRKGVSQAIPPAYTEHIGVQLKQYLQQQVAA